MSDDGTVEAVASAHEAPAREENPVLEHLLFHKALADHDPDQLDEYIALAQGHVTGFPDPFEKALALAFTLVLDEHMDPWRLDLVRFSHLYAERVAAEEEVDLITAGRLLSMAWAVLLRQSEGLLERAQPPEPEPEDPWAMPWDDLPEWGASDDDPDRLYTQRVLAARAAPLVESVWHQGNRRVTLYELVEALEEARHDAAIRQRLAAERAKARTAAKSQGKANMRKIHKEDLEAEILEIRQRLMNIPEEVTFAAIHDGTREDFLTAFIACLFLSRAGMVELRQEQFPTGPILVEPLAALHDPSAPLLGLPDKPAKGKAKKEGPAAKPQDAAPEAADEPAAPTPEASEP